MGESGLKAILKQHATDYGMIAVLALLCAYYSIVTFKEQDRVGVEAAIHVAGALDGVESGGRVLVLARPGAVDEIFTTDLQQRLEAMGLMVAGVVNGQAPDARVVLQKLQDAGGPLAAIACTRATAAWALLEADRLKADFPALAGARVVDPGVYHWPDFLKAENLLNVANRIAIIAIIAIGMTMVIITAGIDLSVGSLIALSAVVAALLIRDVGGGENAGTVAVILGCAAGVAVCAAVGLGSGVMVTVFDIPPFIVTLAVLLMASGLAFRLSGGESVGGLPDGFDALGRGRTLGIPNAVLLMLVLYIIAHVIMTRTTMGRYIYAVGGNPEAARLSGVPVRRILLGVYTICGALAGLAGIIMASQHESGDPKFGQMYELQVIAAVVVGGTSLLGGEGKILATLIGALVIGVINNGMNLTGVGEFNQKIVLGAVILGAVLLDQLKKKGWGLAGARRRWSGRRRPAD